MMSLLNPILWILKDIHTKRFHPICCHQVAFMGYQREDDPPRWKSMGHHTVGFETLEEAQDDVLESCQRLTDNPESFIGEIRYDDKKIMDWDSSKGVPLINSLLTATDYQPYEPEETPRPKEKHE